MRLKVELKGEGRKKEGGRKKTGGKREEGRTKKKARRWEEEEGIRTKELGRRN
jgi:hypothetical protein